MESKTSAVKMEFFAILAVLISVCVIFTASNSLTGPEKCPPKPNVNKNIYICIRNLRKCEKEHFFAPTTPPTWTGPTPSPKCRCMNHWNYDGFKLKHNSLFMFWIHISIYDCIFSILDVYFFNKFHAMKVEGVYPNCVKIEWNWIRINQWRNVNENTNIKLSLCYYSIVLPELNAIISDGSLWKWLEFLFHSL